MPLLSVAFQQFDVVVRAVVQLDPHIVDWISWQDAVCERLPDPILDRLDEFVWDRAADDFVLEHVAGAGLAWIQVCRYGSISNQPRTLSVST